MADQDEGSLMRFGRVKNRLRFILLDCRATLLSGLGSALLAGGGALSTAALSSAFARIAVVAMTLLLFLAWMVHRSRLELAGRSTAEERIRGQNEEIRNLMSRFYRLMADYEEQQKLLDQQRLDLTGSVRRRTAQLVLEKRTLEKQDRLKDEFVSLLAHELRTPLTSVRSYVELLLNYDGDLADGERTEFLGICRSQVRRVSRLINELLDVSRLRSGKFELEARENPLSETVQDVVKSLQSLADLSEQTLQVRGSDAGLIAHCDHDRLVQILTNLVGNALKYSPRGSHVVISLATRARSLVEIRVSDNGPGIENNERELVFEPFYRTRSVGQSNVEGTGLGLYLSRQLARQMGGDLDVEESRAGGACFLLTLPMTAPVAV